MRGDSFEQAKDSKSSTIQRVVGLFQYLKSIFMERNILLDPDLISDISDKTMGFRLLTVFL